MAYSGRRKHAASPQTGCKASGSTAPLSARRFPRTDAGLRPTHPSPDTQRAQPHPKDPGPHPGGLGSPLPTPQEQDPGAVPPKPRCVPGMEGGRERDRAPKTLRWSEGLPRGTRLTLRATVRSPGPACKTGPARTPCRTARDKGKTGTCPPGCGRCHWHWVAVSSGPQDQQLAFTLRDLSPKKGPTSATWPLAMSWPLWCPVSATGPPHQPSSWPHGLKKGEHGRRPWL